MKSILMIVNMRAIRVRIMRKNFIDYCYSDTFFLLCTSMKKRKKSGGKEVYSSSMYYFCRILLAMH